MLNRQAKQNCYIYGATPSQMGLSSLHAWIQLFVCILHISYRLNIKSWQIKKEHKAEIKKDYTGPASQGDGVIS